MISQKVISCHFEEHSDEKSLLSQRFLAMFEMKQNGRFPIFTKL